MMIKRDNYTSQNQKQTVNEKNNAQEDLVNQQQAKQSSHGKAFTSLLWLIIKNDRLPFFFGVLALFLGVLLNLAFPLIIGKDLTSFINLQPEAFVFIIITFVAQGVCFYFRTYSFGILANHISQRIQFKLFFHFISEPDDRSLDLDKLFRHHLTAIKDVVNSKLSVIIRYSLQIILGVSVMVTLAAELTLAIIICTSIVLILGRLFGKRLKHSSSDFDKKSSYLQSLINDLLQDRVLVKLFNFPHTAQSTVASNLTLVSQSYRRRVITSSILQSLLPTLISIFIIFLLAGGIYLVKSGHLSEGDLLAFTIVSAMVSVSASFLIQSLIKLGDGLRAIDELSNFIDLNSIIPLSLPPFTELPVPSSRPQIEFTVDNLTYVHSERTLFENLSFTISAGERVLIAGPSGTGKTTLLRLLLGLEASIEFNNAIRPNVSKPELHEHCSYIPQQAPLYNLPLRANLANDFSISHATVMRLLEELNLHERLAEYLSDADYQTKNLRVSDLSGGEKQRLAIARAILKQPSLLILDEATNALDEQNEKKVFMLIRHLLPKSTVILVSHRSSAKDFCDRVIKLA